ncbi:MAG: HAD family hydrolase [Candidatus Anstonellaceae archaeon]
MSKKHMRQVLKIVSTVFSNLRFPSGHHSPGGSHGDHKQEKKSENNGGIKHRLAALMDEGIIKSQKKIQQLKETFRQKKEDKMRLKIWLKTRDDKYDALDLRLSVQNNELVVSDPSLEKTILQEMKEDYNNSMAKKLSSEEVKIVYSKLGHLSKLMKIFRKETVLHTLKNDHNRLVEFVSGLDLTTVTKFKKIWKKDKVLSDAILFAASNTGKVKYLVDAVSKNLSDYLIWSRNIDGDELKREILEIIAIHGAAELVKKMIGRKQNSDITFEKDAIEHRFLALQRLVRREDFNTEMLGKFEMVASKIGKETNEEARRYAFGALKSLILHKNFNTEMFGKFEEVVSKIGKETNEEARRYAFDVLERTIQDLYFNPDMLTHEFGEALSRVSNLIVRETNKDAREYAFEVLKSLILRESFKTEVFGKFEEVVSKIGKETNEEARRYAFDVLEKTIQDLYFNPDMLTHEFGEALSRVSNLIVRETNKDAREYAFEVLKSLILREDFKTKMLDEFSEIVEIIKEMHRHPVYKHLTTEEVGEKIAQTLLFLSKLGMEKDIKTCVQVLTAKSASDYARSLDPKYHAAVQEVYNIWNINQSFIRKIGAENPQQIEEVIADTARTLAFVAFKTQTTLHRLSEELKRPCIAVYVLSTGFGLRAPTPSMRQFDNQYLSDPKLLEHAFADVFPEKKDMQVSDKDKINELRKQFLKEVKEEMKKSLIPENKDIDAKAERMRCFLTVGSEWMEKGRLRSLVYQTAYKVASARYSITNGSKEAQITDKIGEIALATDCPIVVIDHSTVRTATHSTIAKSTIKDSKMGRAIAQINERLVEKYGQYAKRSGWLSVLNSWSIGDLLADNPSVRLIGFNLYTGIEYKSSNGARKSLWLPTDDRPFFVGREWKDAVSSESARLKSKFMDKNLEVKTIDSTEDYWKAFKEEYLALESQNRLDWARKMEKIVFFDVDGTILKEDKHGFEKGMQKAFMHLSHFLMTENIQKSPDDLQNIYKTVKEDARQRLYSYGRYRDMEMRFYNLLLKVVNSSNLDDDQIVAKLHNAAKEAYDLYIDERMNNSKLYSRALQCIQKLNEKGYNVILMTDRRDSEVYRILQMEGEGIDGKVVKLKDLVKGAIITNDLLSEIETDVPLCRLGLPKESEAYARITKLIKPVLMVGDSQTHDIKPAEKNGISAVLVKDGKGYEKVFDALGIPE